MDASHLAGRPSPGFDEVTAALSFRQAGRCALTDDETRRGWAYLSRVAEPPCPELSTLPTHNGPVEAAERVRRISPGSALPPEI